MTLAKRFSAAIKVFRQKESRSVPFVAVLQKAIGSFLASGMTYQEAVDKGYKEILWVHRCIRILGSCISSVPWHTVRVGAAQFEPIENHPLTKLMNSPNPLQDRQDFWTAWATFLFLSGNCYDEIVFADKVPYQQFHIRPDWMAPVPDPVNIIGSYKLDTKDGRRPITFEPQEIIHYKFIDPTNPYVGMSPLVPARSVIESEQSVIKWNKGMIDNSAVPNGLLRLPTASLSDEDKQKWLEYLRNEFSGDRVGSPLLLWGGMEWDQMGLAPKDLEYGNQRRLNRYDLCAAIGVPAQVAGANEDPTYSNYSIARLAMWEDTVIPLLDWIKGTANSRLAPYFGNDVQVDYDLSQVPAMRDAFTAKLAHAKTLWELGFPINDINRRLGLGMPTVAWGDTAWMPQSMVPVGEIPVATEPEDDEEPDDTEPPDDPTDGNLFPGRHNIQ